ncbi:MAG: dockerin type I repeat-containing protein [Oscillospiraceae bacterium]|nr:dockerin type I repeat-containing protein [Oscillospiraceae bacterium]
MKKSKTPRRALGTALAAAMLAGISIPVAAIEIESPEELISVETVDGTRYLTTTAQRASSEVPLILGVNTIAGNLFNGAIVMAGTDINDNPDPYIWNYNYWYPGTTLSGSVSTTIREGSAADYDENTVYQHGIGTGGTSDGVYSTLSGNAAVPTSANTVSEEYGGVSYGVYRMIDFYIGFSSSVLEQLDFVKNEMDTTSEYYQEGYADYDPMFADMSAGTVTSRAYTWTVVGEAMSEYLENHPELSARYGDPKALCYNLQEFAFGVPYYIDSLLDTGALTKLTGACISTTSDDGLTFTLIDPADAGDVRGDAYAVGNTVNWLVGTYTMEDILDAGAGVIVIYSAGYGYTSSSGTGNTGGGGGGGGGGNAGSTSSTLTREYLEGLMEDVGCAYEDAPVIINAANESVTAGSNGYNFAPTTALYVPYIVAYMYMEQLSALAEAGDDVAAAINPTAMFEYACDEFFHIKDDAADAIAIYWIADNWDSTDSALDKVPDTTDYVYNKDAVVTAIQTGIQYALDNVDNDSIYLNGAYYESEIGYILAHMVTDNGYSSFADVLAAESDYTDLNEVDATALLAYYGEDGLVEMVDNYAAHMDRHAWQPDTTVEGTYAYGMSASEVSESDALPTGDANGDGNVTTIDAVLALRYVNGTAELLDNQITALDVSGNGTVETNDAVYILQYVTGILAAFPADE